MTTSPHTCRPLSSEGGRFFAFYPGLMSMRDVPAPGEREQVVLNEHWPPHPDGYRTHRPGVPVRVRVVFERGGDEWLDGTALRWDREHVYVEVLFENRLRTNGVWVRPGDVRRR